MGIGGARGYGKVFIEASEGFSSFAVHNSQFAIDRTHAQSPPTTHFRTLSIIMPIDSTIKTYIAIVGSAIPKKSQNRGRFRGFRVIHVPWANRDSPRLECESLLSLWDQLYPCSISRFPSLLGKAPDQPC